MGGKNRNGKLIELIRLNRVVLFILVFDLNMVQNCA